MCYSGVIVVIVAGGVEVASSVVVVVVVVVDGVGFRVIIVEALEKGWRRSGKSGIILIHPLAWNCCNRGAGGGGGGSDGGRLRVLLEVLVVGL